MLLTVTATRAPATDLGYLAFALESEPVDPRL